MNLYEELRIMFLKRKGLFLIAFNHNHLSTLQFVEEIVAKEKIVIAFSLNHTTPQAK